jgi:hypothetical protein
MILRKEFPPAIYLSDIRAYLRWYLTLHPGEISCPPEGPEHGVPVIQSSLRTIGD